MAAEERAETGATDNDYSRRGFVKAAGAAGATGVTASLAGCTGGDDSEGDSSGDSSESDDSMGDSEGTGEQDFVWWTLRGMNPKEQEAIVSTSEAFSDWTDANVNVSAEVKSWSSVFEEWSAGVEGRTLPNVSEMANEHAVDFGSRDIAIPNTSLYEQYDDWYDATGIWGQWDDEFWGFPWFIEVRSLYCNMNVLEDAGHDSVPETWAEMIQVAQDISEETEAAGLATAGARDFPTGHALYGFMKQAGADLYSYDEDAGEWRVEIDDADSLFAHLFMLSLREEWDVAPGGWGGIDGTELESLYSGGDAGMMIHATDAARNMWDPIDGINSDFEEVANATKLPLMPEGPAGNNLSFMGGSCLTAFSEEVTDHDVGEEMKMDFIEYMTTPDTMDGYYPEAAPNFLPVREGQEDMELFTDNPTELPDSWLQNRLEQGRNSARYGVSDAGRSAPHLGTLEGETTAYSAAISALIGGDTDDPKTALSDAGETMRGVINDAQDYELPGRDAEDVSLDDASDDVQPWIEGDGVPQIYNPYE